jgi:hypothetical protein
MRANVDLIHGVPINSTPIDAKDLQGTLLPAKGFITGLLKDYSWVAWEELTLVICIRVKRYTFHIYRKQPILKVGFIQRLDHMHMHNTLIQWSLDLNTIR